MAETTICPSCSERPIQNTKYGWCQNCVSMYADNQADRSRAKRAAKAQIRRCAATNKSTLENGKDTKCAGR